jgi:putative ABC transport system ATP-binding protein
VQALKPTSLASKAGELVALLGPSGSGKSTLLLAISLIQPPTTGRITIDGVRRLLRRRPHGRRRARLPARKIGFIFQQHNLIPFLTALENVALMLQLNGVGGAARRSRRAKELLDYLEIGHRADAAGATVGRRAAARGDRPRARQRAGAGAGRRADGGARHRAGHRR